METCELIRKRKLSRRNSIEKIPVYYTELGKLNSDTEKSQIEIKQKNNIFMFRLSRIDKRETF